MNRAPRVLYLAHGRAGYECLNVLTGELKIPPENILGFTYQIKESIPLVQRLEVLGIPYSTEKLKLPENLARVAEFNPDFVISMHFRDIIPRAVFENAPLGGMNLHPSLLPKYRGCFSGPWAIIHQEEQAGISYHYLTPGIDEGRIIHQEALPISPDDTGFSLFNRLIDLGVKRFAQVFRQVTETRHPGREQVGEPSYFKRGVPYDGIIDPQWDLKRIDAFIRALYFPGLRGAHAVTHEGLKEVTTMRDYLLLLEKGSIKK